MRRILQVASLFILGVIASFYVTADSGERPLEVLRPDMGNSMKLQMYGSVVYATCAIGAPASLTLWEGAGAIDVHWSNSRAFQVPLDECMPSVRQQVNAVFRGDEGVLKAGDEESRKAGWRINRKGESWDWTNGRMFVRIDRVLTADNTVLQFNSQYKRVRPRANASLQKIPVYLLVTYP